MTEQLDKDAHPAVEESGKAGILAATESSKAAASSKTEQVLKLLRRKRGATIAELQAATGWQPHSVRGFLSGTVRKKMGLTLTSERAADGMRRYAVTKA